MCSSLPHYGTVFSVKNTDELPLILDIEEQIKDEVVYLVLPVSSQGTPEAQKKSAKEKNNTRFLIEEHDVRDNNVGNDSIARVDLGYLKFDVLTENDLKGDFIALSLCKIVESRSDKSIILDDDFIPTTLDSSASTNITNYHKEVISLLSHRAESVAGRITATGKGGTSDITDFLLLQLVNKNEALFRHLLDKEILHPEYLYQNLVSLYGELSTFTVSSRRPEFYAPYTHEALTDCYAKIMSGIRQSLSMVLEQNAIQIPLQDRNYGISVAAINDKNLLKTAHFVIAVKASIANEVVRSSFPTQVKIGPVEHIRDLVNLQLPGVKIQVLPIAPRQIPYHSGYTYFQLDSQSETWSQLANSGGFAIHVSGNFPDLDMEFWAIKH
ncbi:type VI secretion system baseplate subunit TssK [sulfur-oxidizing endosymbiont of Gigantopelta aegis]|uniref:type VI secretion system baseplate subunit TssK n=1 Tax=sulfur-oxidizing endosymbiont of Gigantopelta aegis TaxID=2794934 RepID=UPI0018DD6C57|nr:type VI secretion system baseplate subunit TssK [sulfur-oxidizing endosymbiont of Gigantopelta aegis]